MCHFSQSASDISLAKSNRYEFHEHTADVALQLWAEDRRGLLVVGAEGMYACCGTLVGGPERVEANVALTGDDFEELFHDWLAELLFLLDARGEWYDSIEVHTLTETRLSVRATGRRIDEAASRFDREVKAVTMHDLRIRETGDGVSTVVILDI